MQVCPPFCPVLRTAIAALARCKTSTRMEALRDGRRHACGPQGAPQDLTARHARLGGQMGRRSSEDLSRALQGQVTLPRTGRRPPSRIAWPCVTEGMRDTHCGVSQYLPYVLMGSE